MILLVFGDRNWTDYWAIRREISRRMPTTVVEGEQRGADKLARLAAESLGIPVLPFPAKWKKYGKAAGHIRNKQMLDEGQPDEAIGFHADIENSRGSKNMRDQALSRGVPTTIYSE